MPPDIDDPSATKASGVIELPGHVRWSGPAKRYNLRDRRDRARVYEQVLREGTEDDVRYYVEGEKLLDMWEELVLPAEVRRAWSSWVEGHQSDSRC
ncbi:MAG: hypothetical protein ACT4OS_06450 [Acidimicrobiales bacterium]